MSLLARLGAKFAHSLPRRGLSLVDHSLLLAPLLPRNSLRHGRRAFQDRCYSSLTSLMSMALPAPALAGRQPAAAALYRQAASKAFTLRPARRYSSWHHPQRSRGSLRVFAGAAVPFPASLPQDGPGRRHNSSKPWWRFWGGPESRDAAAAPPPVQDLHSAAHQRELEAVNTAVAVNGIIMVAKAVVWWLTGSGALLAETLHSIADIMNQVLLRMGVVQSRRAPTTEYPYGFHREKYIYALMSAVSIFCLGAGASLLHGVQALFEPPHLQDMSLSLFVLGGSSLLEFYSLRVAAKAMAAGAIAQGAPMKGWKDWMNYIMRGRDPTTAAVLAEDMGAVAGLGIASLFTTLTWVTGNPVYDAIGSMGVGAVMGGIAMMLIRNNKQFLIGRSMRATDHERLVQHLLGDSVVLNVLDAKSEELGDGVYRFKAEIQWSGERIVEKFLAAQGRSSVYKQLKTTMCTVGMEPDVLENATDMAMMEFGKGVIRTVGEEIDRLETEMKALVPGLRYVDLETDKGRAGRSYWGSPSDQDAEQQLQDKQQQPLQPQPGQV